MTNTNIYFSKHKNIGDGELLSLEDLIMEREMSENVRNLRFFRYYREAKIFCGYVMGILMFREMAITLFYCGCHIPYLVVHQKLIPGLLLPYSNIEYSNIDVSTTHHHHTNNNPSTNCTPPLQLETLPQKEQNGKGDEATIKRIYFFARVPCAHPTARQGHD